MKPAAPIESSAFDVAVIGDERHVLTPELAFFAAIADLRQPRQVVIEVGPKAPFPVPLRECSVGWRVVREGLFKQAQHAIGCCVDGMLGYTQHGYVRLARLAINPAFVQEGFKTIGQLWDSIFPPCHCERADAWAEGWLAFHLMLLSDDPAERAAIDGPYALLWLLPVEGCCELVCGWFALGDHLISPCVR